MNASEQLHEAARALRRGTTRPTAEANLAAAAWLLAEANLAAAPHRTPLPQAVRFAEAVLAATTEGSTP